MANKEHLDILKQGVDVWNQWREEHFEIRPDLSGAYIHKVNLIGVDLRGADLREADFRDTQPICADFSESDLAGAKLSYINFTGANLSKVKLFRADLSGATLERVNLSKADLREAIIGTPDFAEGHYIPNLIDANLSEADLSHADIQNTYLRGAILFRANLRSTFLHKSYLGEANLSEANLSEANLSQTYLGKADLRGAILRNTNFVDASLIETNFNKSFMDGTILASVDLAQAKGLETVQHQGKSYVDIHTIYRSKGSIPEVFLRGAGVDDTFIAYIRSLVGKAIEYYSCFISYSNKDEPFAKRLYTDLQSRNIRCWFAPEDLKIGDKFRHRIDEAIRIYDKLLLVLSEASIASTWVGYEVEKALDKEPEGVPNVLFPIRLDTAILNCETDWAKDIRNSRHIGDFEHWKDHDAYQVAFERLLRDLKAQS